MKSNQSQMSTKTLPSRSRTESEASAYREGPVARSIEKQTAKLPSDFFLWAAFGSIGLSLTLELMKKKDSANFVGHWAPTFLLFGLYNKLVKVAGSDKTEGGLSADRL